MDLQSLLSPSNVALPFAAGLLTAISRKVAGPNADGPLGQRLLPAAPFFWGLVLALGGIGTAGSWRDRLLVGLIAGATSSAVYKLARTTVLGAGLEELDPPKTSKKAKAKTKPPAETAEASKDEAKP